MRRLVAPRLAASLVWPGYSGPRCWQRGGVAAYAGEPNGAWRSRAFAAEAQNSNAKAPLTDTIKVAASSNTGKLAGLIFAHVGQKGTARIEAVGPSATQTAMKALVIATKFWRGQRPDESLLVSATKEERPSAIQGKMTVSTMLQARTADFNPSLPDRPDIFVSGDVNVGLLAGQIRQRLQTNSEQFVMLGCMGAKSTTNALKAVMMAEKWLSELGDPAHLAVVPMVQSFAADKAEGGELTQYILACTRADRG